MRSGPKSIKVNMTLKMIEEAVSFLFPLVTSMYVIRTIGKQNYGEIQYVRSVVSYFTLIASLGIFGYAAREGAKVRDDRQKFQAFSNEIFTISFLSTATALVLLTLFLVFFKKSVNPVLYIIGAAPIAFSLIGRDWINTVYEDFFYVTVRYLAASLVSMALIFVFVRAESDFVLYFLMVNAVTCVLSCLNCVRTRRYSRMGFAPAGEFKKHLNPIFLNSFSGIALKIYLSSDVTLLGILVSKEAVAVYSVAATIYAMVKQVSNSVISVTIPRLSYYTGVKDDDRFHALIEKIVDYVLVLVIPSTVGLFELRSHAMVFIGGSQYSEGGMTLAVLALALPFAVLANVHAQGVLLPRRKEKLFFRATVISAALNIGLNFVLLPIIGHLGAAVTTLLSEAVMFGILLHESNKQIRIHVKKRTVLSAFLGCVPVIVICETAKHFIDNTILCMLAAMTVSVLAYFGVLALRKHAIIKDMKHLLTGLVKRRSVGG